MCFFCSETAFIPLKFFWCYRLSNCPSAFCSLVFQKLYHCCMLKLENRKRLWADRIWENHCPLTMPMNVLKHAFICLYVEDCFFFFFFFVKERRKMVIKKKNPSTCVHGLSKNGPISTTGVYFQLVAFGVSSHFWFLINIGYQPYRQYWDQTRILAQMFNRCIPNSLTHINCL